MNRDRVGFIGLGLMGKSMARGLLGKNIDTLVYDIREEPVRDLGKFGAKAAVSPKEIGALCDITIIMVQTTAQADEVILGKDGVLSSARKGSIIVIMSTVDPLFCKRVEEAAKQKGIGVLDAPVSGGPKGAEAHTLSLTVGGERDLLERCRYVFDAMASKIFHVGGIGTGQVIKLAINSIIYATAIATVGGITLAAKAGVGLKGFLEIIQASAANSWVAHNWEHWQKKGRPEEKAALDVTYKDLKLMLDLSKSWGVSLPLAEVIGQLDIRKIIADTERVEKVL
jgi:3-hydroxyisobutyrate dehydrogenase-like beta-hydroxyacid dehydrogenase